MSEEPQLAVTADQINALPPDSKAALLSQLQKHYPQQAAQLAGGTAAATASSPAATQLPGSDARISVPNDGLTREQRLAGYRKALAFAPDQGAVIASAERDGISRAELETVPQSPAEAAAAQREADAMAAMSPPASSSDYRLQYPRETAATVPPDELQAFDAAARTAFHAAGVPKNLANGLLNALLQTGDLYPDGMSEAARALKYQEEGARLRKLSGDLSETVRLANLAYNALPKSFREVVHDLHLAHSAQAQVALAQVGRAIEYREGRKR